MITTFVAMYEPPEAWEDTIVYPALQATTPQKTLDELAARFADLATAQYGSDSLQVVLSRVTALETTLGIHDMNAFTPPAGPTR